MLAWLPSRVRSATAAARSAGRAVDGQTGLRDEDLSLDPPADSGGPFPAPIPARGVFRGESGCGRPAARLACGLSGVPGSGAGFGWPVGAVAGADRIGAGQAAAAGGPQAAANRF